MNSFVSKGYYRCQNIDHFKQSLKKNLKETGNCFSTIGHYILGMLRIILTETILEHHLELYLAFDKTFIIFIYKRDKGKDKLYFLWSKHMPDSVLYFSKHFDTKNRREKENRKKTNNRLYNTTMTFKKQQETKQKT